jgi:cytochrome c oxidase cbb3-type subunit 3
MEVRRATILLAAVLLAACNRNETQTAEPGAEADLPRLATVATDEIPKNPELNAIALSAGEPLYREHCAGCHGVDLKGVAAQHAPDMTDVDWIFAGDDLNTGGFVHLPSDIEKTVRFGIRAVPRVTDRPTQRENDELNAQNKNFAEMPAMGGAPYNLTEAEMADVTEYVLQITNQEHDAAMAMRGKTIFEDKGSCYDCHGQEGTGDMALGSTNLTQARLFLYGSDRASILASVKEGRRTVMPAFEGQLRPEEIKAIAVYTMSKAHPGEFPAPPQ